MKYIMLLWGNDSPELELDMRGLGINKFLSLRNPDVSSVFSRCH